MNTSLNTCVKTLFTAAAAGLALGGCATEAGPETVEANQEVQELGIAGYLVTEGAAATVAQLFDPGDRTVGVIEHWADGAGVDHLTVRLDEAESAPVLEIISDASTSPGLQQILVDGQVRAEWIGSDAPDLLNVNDVARHLRIASATRSDPALAAAFGDRSDEVVAYGVCLGAIPRSVACGVCATKVMTCKLFAFNVLECLQSDAVQVPCFACVACEGAEEGDGAGEGQAPGEAPPAGDDAGEAPAP